MIFHDPYDWGVEMQILSDVLAPLNSRSSGDDSRGSDANDSRPIPQQRIPLFASNNDLIYSTEFPLPRYTQGAFTRAFAHLFNTMYGTQLQVEYFGKPFPVQYEYAAMVLQSEAQRIGASVVGNSGATDGAIADEEVVYFGVGDNPKSDIRGANNAGPQWRSVLVRTGVFNDINAANDVKDPADFVCDDLSAAVDLIIRYSNY